jgi:hypothetical protein
MALLSTLPSLPILPQLGTVVDPSSGLQLAIDPATGHAIADPYSGAGVNAPLGTTPTTGINKTPAQVLGDGLNKAGQQLSGAKNALLHPLNTFTDMVFTSRLLFLILGLMLIGAGLYSFKTTQTIIETGTTAAKGAAKIAGTVAA